MEIDRIRFVLSSYLRSRLQKVSGVGTTACKADLPSVPRWQSCLISLCLDREVFPACPGEGKVSTGWRSVAAFTPGVCLCQRVSRIKSGLFCFMLLLRLWHLIIHVDLVFRYYANTESYLKTVALKRMPPNLQTVDMLKAGISPHMQITDSSICQQLMTFVFFLISTDHQTKWHAF